MPATLADWLRVTALGAEMAGAGEAQSRAARYGAAVHASGIGAADGGMPDRTLGDMLQALGAQQAVQ